MKCGRTSVCLSIMPKRKPLCGIGCLTMLSEATTLLVQFMTKKWFHGWQGAPDGCRMKQVTTAPLSVCSPIASDKISQIFVYLDASATMCDTEPTMS